MKFCPQCGSKLPKGTVQSCSICGINLWPNTISDTNIVLPQQPTEYTPLQSPSVDQLGKVDEIKGEFRNQTLYSLLAQLQKTIEEILKNKEYFQGQTAESTNYREARLVEIKKPSPILSINVSINLSSLL